MGAAELRTAFNEGAAGRASCARATLHYENHSDVQWQILTFYGTDATGQPFEARANRLRPESDVIVAARDFGKAFADQLEASNAKVAEGTGGASVPGGAAG